MTDMPLEDDPSRAAAELSGVANLVEAEPPGSEDFHRLRLAAAVSGAADGCALRHASALIAGTGDPAEVVSELRFTAVGMAGSDPEQAALLWTNWTVRQARARVTTVSRPASDAERSVPRWIDARSEPLGTCSIPP